jgi:hypothetical protein
MAFHARSLGPLENTRGLRDDAIERVVNPQAPDRTRGHRNLTWNLERPRSLVEKVGVKAYRTQNVQSAVERLGADPHWTAKVACSFFGQRFLRVKNSA